jgi:hypothetical protein
MQRPYGLGQVTVGALYERPRSFRWAKPVDAIRATSPNCPLEDLLDRRTRRPRYNNKRHCATSRRTRMNWSSISISWLPASQRVPFKRLPLRLPGILRLHWRGSGSASLPTIEASDSSSPMARTSALPAASATLWWARRHRVGVGKPGSRHRFQAQSGCDAPCGHLPRHGLCRPHRRGSSEHRKNEPG